MADHALSQGKLSEGKIKELKSFLEDTRITFLLFNNAIKNLQCENEVADNLIFIFYRQMDRLMHFGALVTLDEGAINIAKSVIGAGKTGGQKSGTVRKNKADYGWRTIAREMAKSVRNDHPDYSQDKVAEEISIAWKDANIAAPGHPTLKGFIAELEKSGDILRMIRKPTKGQRK